MTDNGGGGRDRPPACLVRPAAPADEPAVRVVTDAAYGHYVDRIGLRPAPMDADHQADIAAGRVFVTGDPVTDDPVAGVLVLTEKADHLLLESVAVLPEARGRGLGRRLLAFAERYARERGLPEVRLYTNVLMSENQEIYPRYGYEVTERRQDGPYDRVHYRKRL